METKHTPTPWVLPEGYDTVGLICGEIPIRASGDEYTAPTVAIVKAKEGRRVLSNNIVADAAFIVRACNAHDDLVEALVQVRELLSTSTTAYKVQIALDFIGYALAKARGEA